jgi:hypothetical protein
VTMKANTKNYEPKDLALCIATLDSIACWDDLARGHDPAVLNEGQDEPHAALAARKTLVQIGYRTADGKVAGTLRQKHAPSTAPRVDTSRLRP